MRNPLYLLLLLVAGCQQHQPNQPTTSPAIVAAEPEQASTPANKAAPPAALTPEMRAMLQHIQLSPLFLAPERRDSEMALDGFFGTNPQRLSLAILQAVPDGQRPEVIHVVGKARNQKQISSFAGDIQLTAIADFDDQGILLTQAAKGFAQDTLGDGSITNARAYTATATFHLTSNTPASYELTGQVFLDFWAMDDGTVGIIRSPCQGCELKGVETRGSGLVMKGSWQDLTSKMTRPFQVSRDVFLLSPDVIKDFGIGDRSSQVNPKYARMGWSNYWENDEWWAESPKPSLNL